MIIKIIRLHLLKILVQLKRDLQGKQYFNSKICKTFKVVKVQDLNMQLQQNKINKEILNLTIMLLRLLNFQKDLVLINNKQHYIIKIIISTQNLIESLAQLVLLTYKNNLHTLYNNNNNNSNN